MAVSYGSWIGDGRAGRWSSCRDPALVTDPRYADLQAAAADSDFSAACVLVTGASEPRSIGYAIARNFLRGGARVVIIGQPNLGEVTAAARRMREEAGAGTVLPACLDQGDLDAIDAFFAWAKAAGLIFTHLYPYAAVNEARPFSAIRSGDYARVFAVNTFGVHHLCVRHARACPRRTPWYVVLPLSPNNGRLRGSGLYSPSKQAIRSIVVQGQHEVGTRRGGVYIGLDIAWTRSSLMSGLEDLLRRARDIGLVIFEPDDTAEVSTVLGTPAARALAGDVLDAGGNFGTTSPEAFASLFAE